MQTITIDDVLESGYCERYDEATIRRLWGKRETATALDILDSHLPPEDRVWLVLNTPSLTDEQLHTFRAALAHYVADIYESYYPNDSRVRDCADAWQRLAAGEDVNIEHFKAAAMATAWAAASAAGAAAWDAAAWAAASAAAWDKISRWLRDICEVYDGE